MDGFDAILVNRTKLKKMVFDMPNDMELGRAFRNMVIEMEEFNDRCKSCNEDTPYQTDTHINHRRYYVEGAGQLCEPCWDNIYG